MLKQRKHVIWGDINLNLEDWRDDIWADLEKRGYRPDEITEDLLYDEMIRTNASYLDDERVNLNVQLSQPILVIAYIGRWNGRFSGYREIESGNIKDCLYSDTDYTQWYIDERGDLCCTAIHHDGTNRYLYRVFKDCATDAQRERLKEKIYNDTATRADITRITRRLGDDVAAVYGFDIPGREPSENEG